MPTPNGRKRKRACDLWTAAFFQPLTADATVITGGMLAKHLKGEQILPQEYAHAETIFAAPENSSIGRWSFPEVFAEGGFDCVACPIRRGSALKIAGNRSSSPFAMPKSRPPRTKRLARN